MQSPTPSPPPPTLAVGGATDSPPGKSAAQAILVRQSPVAGSGGHVQGLAILADGAAADGRPDLASSLALDAIEAEVGHDASPALGASFARGAQRADAALKARSLCPWDPQTLGARAAIVALRGGYWTVLEAGPHQVYVLRRGSFGPVFASGPLSAPLGGAETPPRIASFRAQPGDLLLAASYSVVERADMHRVASALRAAPNLSEGCRAVLTKAAAAPPASMALVAVRVPDRQVKSSSPLWAGLAAAALLSLAVVLTTLSMIWGPSDPVIPPEAQQLDLAARAAGATGEPEAAAAPKPEMKPLEFPMPGESDESEAAKESEPPAAESGAGKPAESEEPDRTEPARAATGQIKVPGPPGTTIEVREDRPGGKSWVGEVRKSQGSYVFYRLPAPADYVVTVWETPARKRRLVREERVRLGKEPVKVDVPEP